MHALTILLRRAIVFTLAFGIVLPLVFVIHWLCPEDWRHHYQPEEGTNSNG